MAGMTISPKTKVVAPFMPAPLVDKASSLGISHWITQESDLFVLYFCRA